MENCCILAAGDHGKPPALPRSGRTQLLLAAARKAQTAAFPIADPYSCETADQPVASQVWAGCAYVINACACCSPAPQRYHSMPLALFVQALLVVQALLLC